MSARTHTAECTARALHSGLPLQCVCPATMTVGHCADHTLEQAIAALPFADYQLEAMVVRPSRALRGSCECCLKPRVASVRLEVPTERPRPARPIREVLAETVAAQRAARVA